MPAQDLERGPAMLARLFRICRRRALRAHRFSIFDHRVFQI
jgi:hypothetical protein